VIQFCRSRLRNSQIVLDTLTIKIVASIPFQQKLGCYLLKSMIFMEIAIILGFISIDF